MKYRYQKLPPRSAAFLLGLGGLLCLLSIFVSPMQFAGAQDVHRVRDAHQARDIRDLQVWPDRSVGVFSGMLGDVGHVAPEVFPLGAYVNPEGEAVYARTYLHFPLDVFPPGTDITHATLYVYVDGASSVGETTLGVYRALEAWDGGVLGWDSHPDAWPALLDSPFADTMARFDEITTTLPVTFGPLATPTVIPTVTLTLTPTATFTPTATPTPAPTSTPTATSTSPSDSASASFDSPLLTPSPASTFTPTPTPTPTPPSAPTPFPTPALRLPLPVVQLGQVPGTWLTWNVTALMRAWHAGEVPNDGLALASAPDFDAVPEAMNDLLVARWIATADSDTKPHVIVEFQVHPVTPTPTQPASPLSTPIPVLPAAGGHAKSYAGWGNVGLFLAGAVLLALGLVKLRLRVH